MDLATSALALGVTLRATRLIARDSITADARAWVIRRWGPESKPAEGISCPWCVSVWIAAAATPVAYLAGDSAAFQIAGTAAWATYLTGLAATWLEERA